MTLHQGQIYQNGAVSLRPPAPDLVQNTSQAEDVREAVNDWLSQAIDTEEIYYFSVYVEQQLVGEIFLHDIDKKTNEALIGYHLFEPSIRGQGIGTKMLMLLTQFVQNETNLKRLIIITSRDNIASQRVAEKCDFRCVGTPREDPINGVLYEWIATTR